ncbi:MAG: DoxX family membrane protein [Candidatus Kapabacteria bacterium]|nr:DoxX family membrane protein [Candidatus Kapabacteria bacterium]
MLIGRILFCIPFIAFGLMHVTSAEKMAGLVPAWMPGGLILVYIVGIAELAAAASILIGKKTHLAGQLLALLLLIFVFTIHIPGMLNATDEMTKMMSLAGALKDLGLAGGALFVSHIYSDRT